VEHFQVARVAARPPDGGRDGLLALRLVGGLRVLEMHIVEADGGIRGDRCGRLEGGVVLVLAGDRDDLLDAAERAERLVHRGEGAEG